MSHDAPVNTTPTQAAASLDPVPGVTILFDVADLERSTRFYADTLGFRVVLTERRDLPYETRVMTSDRYPGVALFARKTFQRPVSGSTVGGIVQIGFHEPNLAERLAELDGRVTWASGPTENQPSPPRVSFMDPDGYVVELFR